MFVQNDASVYYQDQSANDEENAKSPQECLKTLRASLNEDGACEEVLDAFRSNRNQKACEGLNMLLLEDVILYVAEEELELLVEDFCCLTGATKVDTVTPCLTTHIVCMKETPELRGMIGSIHAKVNSGATSAKAALTTERSHLDIVTPNWLKVCLLRQRLVQTSLFRPEVVKTTTESVLAAVGKTHKAKSGLAYRLK